jgi:hypothetical protein
LKEEYRLDGQSSEGGLLRAYSDSSNNLRRLEVSYFGEMGKLEIVYIFLDRKVIWMRETTTQYRRPLDPEEARNPINVYFYDGNQGYRIEDYNLARISHQLIFS